MVQAWDDMNTSICGLAYSFPMQILAPHQMEHANMGQTWQYQPALLTTRNQTVVRNTENPTQEGEGFIMWKHEPCKLSAILL
ncbi:hypothetical protein NC652_009946 [Populus alba x Populus x berolinensis]|nr:hypothetical protein NC652_009946 [Populus alba x Populus x berolinensis]